MSELVLLFILILANAYFAAAEIAFISLNDAKLDVQAKEGNKKAKSIKKILENPSKFFDFLYYYYYLLFLKKTVLFAFVE